LVDFIIEFPLLIVKSDRGKDAVLDEKVIAHGGLLKELVLDQFLLLAKPA